MPSQSPRTRRASSGGFTVIELMVIVLVVAIVIAITVPAVLGARTRAQDTQARTSASSVVDVARAAFVDQRDYRRIDRSELADAVGALRLRDASQVSAGPDEVSIGFADADTEAAGNDTFYAVARSESGSCFARKDVRAATGAGTYEAEITAGACSAANARSGTFAWSGV